MIRRRKFLNRIKNLSAKTNVLQLNLIYENLYFNDKFYFFSKSRRFFWKKIVHLYKNFKFFSNINSFSKYFIIMKKYFQNYYFILNYSNINCNTVLLFKTINLLKFKPYFFIKYKKISTLNINFVSYLINLIFFTFMRSLLNYKILSIGIFLKSLQSHIYFVFRKKNFL